MWSQRKKMKEENTRPFKSSEEAEKYLENSSNKWIMKRGEDNYYFPLGIVNSKVALLSTNKSHWTGLAPMIFNPKWPIIKVSFKDLYNDFIWEKTGSPVGAENYKD